jgi:hypothetical protein
MATTTTAISLDDTLLARISARASELELSLSRLLAMAAEEYLAVHTRRRLPSSDHALRARQLKQINEAWGDGLDGEERRVMRGMQRQYRKSVKDPW